jgi:hypothetical protein
MMREITLEEAKPIWDRFVPKKQVWTDDWDIRVALCREYKEKPLILYDGKNFFPLQFEAEHGYYTIIGGTTAEKNPVSFDPQFMKTTDEIPKKVYFDSLEEKFDGCTEALCPQFFIDLDGIDGIDDYIKRFSGKHGKNFKRLITRFGAYEFVKGGTFEEMGRMNKVMFGEKSDFATENLACYEILDRDPRTEYWSVVKDGKKVMILQYFFYNRTMAVCVWGVDRGYDETLRVAFAEGIKLARSRGCTRIDYAPTYSPWKFLYRLDTAPLWRYKRGDIPDSVERAECGIPPDERERLKAEGRL